MQLSLKLPFSGFYETSHSAMLDNWLDYEQDMLMTEHGATLEQVQELAEKFYSGIEWRKVHIEYAKAYTGELETLLNSESPRIVNMPIVFESLESPKEYNFATDCIYGQMGIADLQYMLSELDEKAWRDFIRERCTSYDGFISYYSNDYDKWEKDLTLWGEARLGMILELYLVMLLEPKELEEELSAFSLMERIDGNGYISNWLWENANEDFKQYADSLRKDI